MNLTETVVLVQGFLARCAEDGVREDALHVITSKQSASCVRHWEECECSPVDDVDPDKLAPLALAFVGLMGENPDPIGVQAGQFALRVLKRMNELGKAQKIASRQ